MRNTQFKKGDNRPRKPKGAISKKTQIWNELGEFVIESGAQKFITELQKLEGREYIQYYCAILEYFKPKLARQEIKTEDVTNNQVVTIGLPTI